MSLRNDNHPHLRRDSGAWSMRSHDARRQQAVLVTGATSGVGRIIALHLAAGGARVTGVGRDEAALAGLKAEAAGLSGELLGARADVTDHAAVRRALDVAEEAHGPVDALIACAGSLEAVGPVTEVEVDAWWRDVTTDLLGAFLTMREAAGRMLARRAGKLISVYGNLGDRGESNVSAFATAKAAVARFTECLTTELAGTGVSAFCVHPGFVRTRLTEALAWGHAGRRYLPGFGARAETRWSDGHAAAVLVDAIMRGDADSLTGRVLWAGDDLTLLADQVSHSPDLRRLRLTLEVAEQPAP